MRVIAPFDSAQGAMTLIALTALAVAISTTLWYLHYSQVALGRV